jgi:hypothetical protein
MTRCPGCPQDLGHDQPELWYSSKTFEQSDIPGLTDYWICQMNPCIGINPDGTPMLELNCQRHGGLAAAPGFVKKPVQKRRVAVAVSPGLPEGGIYYTRNYKRTQYL